MPSLAPTSAATERCFAFLPREFDAGETAYAELLHEVLGEQGVHVSQFVIGDPIEAGHPEKDPAQLAAVIWDLHHKRDRFRVEVATG